MAAPSGAFYSPVDRLLAIGELLVTQLNRAHLDVLFQSGQVQTDGLPIEIPVLTDLKARVTEDDSKVSP